MKRGEQAKIGRGNFSVLCTDEFDIQQMDVTLYNINNMIEHLLRRHNIQAEMKFSYVNLNKFDRYFVVDYDFNLTRKDGVTCEIPLKLPSLNEYVDACRNNPYRAAKMKKGVENDIMWFVKKLPKFDKPIFIHYHWIEGNRRRDYDNICGGGRKFILDAMVKAGRLKDDNRNCVVGHTDTFGYEKGKWKVILEIEERNE